MKRKRKAEKDGEKIEKKEKRKTEKKRINRKKEKMTD